MEKSRVEKFKEYRKLLQSESFIVEQKSNNEIPNLNGGNLPLDYVIKETEIQKELTFKDKIERNWPVIRLILIVIGLCALVAVIILLAIYIGRA